MINIGSRGDDDGLVSAPVAANNASNRALGATNTSDPTGLAPSSGLGESGVIGGSSLLGSSDWQNQISVNVTRPASNDTLAFMTVSVLPAIAVSDADEPPCLPLLPRTLLLLLRNERCATNLASNSYLSVYSVLLLLYQTFHGDGARLLCFASVLDITTRPENYKAYLILP